MTHNTPTPVADKELAERLLELSVKSTQDPLNDDGRYFNSGWHNDLTQCSHGETGNYSNKRNGQYIAALWNAHRSGQLITLAEAQAMVAAAERRIWAEADETIAIMREQFNSGNARFCAGIELEDLPAIRAAATGTKEGM